MSAAGGSQNYRKGLQNSQPIIEWRRKLLLCVEENYFHVFKNALLMIQIISYTTR